MEDSIIVPAEQSRRKLTQLDLGLIWFGAAICISEIWAGGLGPLTALGLGAGLVAIVLGRIVGNGLMAAMARIGAQTGLPTMVLTRPAFGIRGSYILAFFNMLQLVGWTGWMVFIAAEYSGTLAGALGLAWDVPQARVAALAVGALCTLWALWFAGQWWWKWIERVSAALLLLLTVAMTALVLRHTGLSGLPPGNGSALGILVGMDLVIAMSVSWLPLVADYSRFSISARHGGRGTFWGYFIGGTWMYAVGLLVALATTTDTPDAMVVQIMSGGGGAWVVLAIVLVLLSTVTTTFLDIYSAAVSAQSLWPRLSTRAGSIWCGVLGTLCALLLNVHAYAKFLIAIGAIFLPAFTVVLVNHYFVARGMVDTSQVGARGGLYWYIGGYNWRALLAWLTGFLVYDWAQGFPSLLTMYSGIAALASLPAVNPALPTFPYGASLPCMAATTAVYFMLTLLFGNGRQRLAKTYPA